MHLGLALTNWLICGSVWQHVSAKSSNSKPHSSDRVPPKVQPGKSPLPSAQAWLERLESAQQKLQPVTALPSEPLSASEDVSAGLALLEQPELFEAMRNEAARRATSMLEGVADYRASPLPRTPLRHRVIWRDGTTRLLDYGGGKHKPALLCVPSLINRYYVLDLYPKRSFVRVMKEAGFRVLVVDWDAPGKIEQSFSTADYVERKLLPLIDHLSTHHAGTLHLMGYCMGGVLALAAAQLRRERFASLSLLATPWALNAPALATQHWQMLEALIDAHDALPVRYTQSFFHLIDPWHFQKKFAELPSMSPQKKRHFISVERWVNDGVPLAKEVARDFYLRWPREQMLQNGTWRVQQQAISPARLDLPTLVVMPQRDRIVPPESSAPLMNALAQPTALTADCGHVSMVVGSRARSQLLRPMVRWLRAQN